MKSFIIYISISFFSILSLYSATDSTDQNKNHKKEDVIKWHVLPDSLSKQELNFQQDTINVISDTIYLENDFVLPVLDTTVAENKENKIDKVLIGSVENDQLSLFIEDTVITQAISKELSDTFEIEKMLIHRDFDGSYSFYLEGKLGKKPIVIRIKLFLMNEAELYMTEDSFMEYCLSERKCKSPAFADLYGCKCLNGSSKNVSYNKIDKLNLKCFSRNK
jgi:hypothetical protein